MSRTIRSIAYVAAFCTSLAVSAYAFSRLFEQLPSSGLGVLLGALAIASIAFTIASVESALVWRHWLQAEGRHVPQVLRARSSLLRGLAPLPIALGVLAGAVVAVKLF